MTRSSPMWRFDSVDLRSGIGFASWRQGIIPTEDTALFQNTARPMLYCTAPDFTLVPITNPALAQSAARGGGEFTTLSAEAGELGFDSPESLRSFLRRAYVRRNGGGPGGEGVGGGGGPGPEPGPRGDRFPHEPNQREFMQLIGDFSLEVEQATPGSARPFSWYALRESGPGFSLENGVIAILSELERNYPQNESPDLLLEWQKKFRALTEVIWRLELSLSLMHDTWFRIVRDIADRIPLDYSLFFELPYDGWPQSSNKIELLQRLSMPTCALEKALRKSGQQPTLFHLISSFCADPTVVMNDSNAPQVLDSLLLGVTFLCQVEDAWPRSRSDLRWQQAHGVDSARRSIYFAAAMEWLSAQLPDRAFHRTIEAVITGKELQAVSAGGAPLA